MTTDARPAAKITAQKKNGQKENDLPARTTAADEADILLPHNLRLNCTLRSLA